MSAPYAHELLNPKNWKPAKGYANGVAAEGRQVFLGGHIGWNGQQEFETDDFVGQVDQTLANIVAVLAEARCRPTASGSPDLVHHQQNRISGPIAGDRRGLSHPFWAQLSGNGYGSGRCPDRGSRQGRDRGNRSNSALTPSRFSHSRSGARCLLRGSRYPQATLQHCQGSPEPRRFQPLPVPPALR